MAEGYDRKHKKAPPKSDNWKKPHNKKNTKKWCKGVVGREHITRIELMTTYSRVYVCGERHKVFPFYVDKPKTDTIRWACFHQEVCTVCRKVLAWNLRKERCPDYIKQYGVED